MKKAIICLSAFLVLGFAIYHFFPNWSQACNNSLDEEYYYNEIEYIEEVSMADTNLSNTDPAPEMDTTPDSLTVLVNKDNPLPEDYVPEDLVIPDIPFSFANYSDKKLMRQEAAEALKELFDAAAEEGLNLYGVSGYRSYQRQKEIYDRNVAKNGVERTNQYSAMPGHSEHQTGLAMDVSTISIHNRLDTAFSGTPEGKWLADNSYKYGFIIRYPEGKSEITGYAYEPWHIRYVGKELAQELAESGLTLDEYYGYVPSDDVQSQESYGATIDVGEEEYIEEDGYKDSEESPESSEAPGSDPASGSAIH